MSQMPTKKDILAWISAHPTLSVKRDIAKAFHIKGAARIDLKRLLKELEEEAICKSAKTPIAIRINYHPSACYG